jgi:glycosyltransferase involved in cell wall biosynthesis
MQTLTHNVLGEVVFDTDLSEKILEKLNASNGFRDKILQSADTAACFAFLEKIMVLCLEISEMKQRCVPELHDNRLFKQIESIMYSIINVMQDFEKTASLEKTLYRIEFETFPIIEETIATFTYFNFAALAKESEEAFWNPETGKAKALWFNRYAAESQKTGEYKYELSIIVLAFNNWEMTKQCVDSLLRWMPADLNFELILFNHGSTDGVKRYFESVNPTKQLDIKINSCSLLHTMHRVIEGKYFLQISNDVIMTPNAVENMLRACKDDPKIGYLVPSTPNVSGLQTVDIGEYSSIDEFNILAAKNNVYDPIRHEERVALCNPLAFYPSSVYFAPDVLIGGKIYRIDEHKYAFPDDLTSLLIRRKGYKVVLQNDAFCHHFGSITLGKETTPEEKQKSLDLYNKGCERFKEYYGINPWSIGKCYHPAFSDEITEILSENAFEGRINILGINCGLGSDPLRIKTLYKELFNNSDVHITNYTNMKCFERDLKTVSEKAEYIEDLSAKLKSEKKGSYHYIVLEIPVNKTHHTQEIFNICTELLTDRGVLSIHQIENYDEDNESLTEYVRYPFECLINK